MLQELTGGFAVSCSHVCMWELCLDSQAA